MEVVIKFQMTLRQLAQISTPVPECVEALPVAFEAVHHQRSRISTW